MGQAATPAGKQMINLASIISNQTTPAVTKAFDNSIELTRLIGEAQAYNAQFEGQAKLAAAQASNDYAQSFNYTDTITKLTQDYITTSEQARQSHKQAADQLQKLNDQANVSVFDSPLQWLGNQITFEDDYKATQAAVGAAASRSNEAQVLQSEIMGLNNAVQENTQTNNSIAITSSAQTIANSAQILKNSAQIKANETEIQKLQTGADLKVRAVNLTMGAEEAARSEERMAMDRERLAMEKQRLAMEKAKRDAEEKDKATYMDSMWNAAIRGTAKLKGVDAKTAEQMLGVRPKSLAEMKMREQQDRNFYNASTVGFRTMYGDPSPYGEGLGETAQTLVETGSQGNSRNGPVVNWMKNIFIKGATAEADPKKKAAAGEAAITAELAKQGRAGADAKDATGMNVYRLPAPAEALLGGANRSPEVQSAVDKLKANPLIQNLQTSGLLSQDDPSKIIQASATWAALNKVDPSTVSKTLTDLYAVTAAQHHATLEELRIPTEPLRNLTYHTTIGTLAGGMLGKDSFSVLKPQDIQKLVISSQRQAVQNELRKSVAGENPMAQQRMQQEAQAAANRGGSFVPK